MEDASIKIPAELFATAEGSSFQGVLDPFTLKVGPDEYRFQEPLPWSVDVTNTGSAFLVTGTVSATALVPCSRCLNPATYDFQGAIEGYYLLDGAECDGGEEEDAPGEDEFERLPDDHIIDLRPLIMAALMVDAPTLPLCDPDCKGLCPHCGADLNEGLCHCDGESEAEAFERAANPFSVLADYEFSEN